MNSNTAPFQSTPPTTWPYRLWRDQAARLYPGNPFRQRQALAEHLQIAMHCTSSPQRWLWLAALAAAMSREVAHD